MLDHDTKGRNPGKRVSLRPVDVLERGVKRWRIIVGDCPRPGQALRELGLSRSDGMDGGTASARKLSDEQRSELAKKAAKARWDKQDQSSASP